MGRAAVCFFVFLRLLPLHGAEWPRAFQQYEELAVKSAPSGEFVKQLWQYATSAPEREALRARWQERAKGAEAWRYQLLLGHLATLEGEPTRARGHFEEAVKSGGERAECQLALALFDLREKAPGARAAVEKALAMPSPTEPPSHAYVALAEDYFSSNEPAAGLAVLETATLLLRAPRRRLHAAREWTRRAFEHGSLPEVFTKLEADRKQGRDDGSGLAAVFGALQDFPAAEAAIDAARQAFPQDASLHALALHLTRDAPQKTRVVQLLRAAAAEQPSPAVWADFFKALADAGSATEARRVLLEHPNEIAAAPARWRTAGPALWRLGLASEAAALLEPRRDSWEAVFARGELLITERAWPAAAEALWSLFEPKFDDAPLSSLMIAEGHEPQPDPFPDFLTGGPVDFRLSNTQALAEKSPLIFSPHEAAGGVTMLRLGTIQNARDWALVYLAFMATDTKRVPEFLAEADARTARLHPGERVFTWSALECPPQLLEAIAAYLGGNAHTHRLDSLCRDQLQRISDMRNADAPQRQRAKELGEALKKSLPRPKPAPPVAETALVKRLAAMLRDEPTISLDELRDRGVMQMEDEEFARFVSSHPDRFQPMTYFMGSSYARWSRRAVKSRAEDAPIPKPGNAPPNSYEIFRRANDSFVDGKFADALTAYADAATLPRASWSISGQGLASAVMPMAQWIPKFAAKPEQAAEAAATVVQCIALDPPAPPKAADRPSEEALWPQQQPGMSYGTRFTSGPGRPRFVHELPEEVRAKLVYPPATLCSWAESGVLWTVFSTTREEALWPAVKKRLAAIPPDAPPERALFLRAALAYLMWWNGEWDEAENAMRKLLADTADDRIRLALAAMLRKREKWPEAIARLGEIKRPQPAFRRVLGGWQLRLAAEAKDAGTLARLARELEEEPFGRLELRPMVTALEEAGFGEAAAPFRARLAALAAPEEEVAKISAALKDLVAAGEADPVRTLARRVVDDSIRAAERSPTIAKIRKEAMEVLEVLGEREAYAAGLAQRLAATKDGKEQIEMLLRVAEATADWSETRDEYAAVLRRDPANRLAALAMLERNSSDHADQPAAFEALLATDPEETMTKYLDKMLSVYVRTKTLPRLAAQLAKAPFTSSAGRRGGRSTEERWLTLARRMAGAGEPAAAVAVLTKAGEVTETTWEVGRLLLQEAEKAGRDDLLVPVLLQYLTREPSPRAPQLFAFRESSRAQPPPPPLEPGLLKLAQRAGVLPQIRARLEKEAPQRPAAKTMLTYLRVLLREPESLPEVRALTAGLKPREGAQTWVLPLVRELAAWPEAADTCLALLTAHETVAAGSASSRAQERIELAKLALQAGSIQVGEKIARDVLASAAKEPGSSSGAAVLAAGEMALSLRNTTLLAECTQAIEQRLTGKENQRSSELRYAYRFAGLLLDADRTEESAALVARLRKAAPANDSQAATTLRGLSAELELRRGELLHMAPAAWIDPARTTPERAAVAWDLALPGYGRPSALPRVRGEPVRAVSGTHDLELLFGETEDTLHVLAKLPKAESRGIWHGPLPAANGFLRAVFTRGEAVSFGALLPVSAGANLLPAATPEEPAWGLPREFSERSKGGPAPGGDYVAYRPTVGTRDSEPVLAGRVKLSPHREYVVSGWLRCQGDSSLRPVVRFFDKDGKVVSTSSGNWYVSDRRWWNYFTQRLRWPENGNSREIPANAAYAAPAIENGAGGFDLAGLSLVEVPVAVDRDADE